MEVILKDAEQIRKEIGIDDNGPVQAYFTNACYRYMDKYVPMDTGALRRTIILTTDSITYASQYATYQYLGVREDGTHKINPDNYTTPNTGPYWDREMVSAEKDDLVKEVVDFAKRRKSNE